MASGPYDAVQLASAVAVRTANPGCNTFCAFDEQLAIAARNQGFRVVQ
jgi:predicted nucleic acid-binding protein